MGCSHKDPEYFPRFIPAPEADALLRALSVLSWDQHQINMYGKIIPAPRMFAWMGTPPAKLYGKPVPVTEWTPEAIQIREKVAEKTGVVFDSLNINVYRSNEDYLGWHIDPEDEGLWEYPIASVSFGAERPFQWRPYRKEGKKRVPEGEITTQVLQSGSLLVMPPGFQGTHVHRLPKSSSKSKIRINLTFRKMRA